MSKKVSTPFHSELFEVPVVYNHLTFKRVLKSERGKELLEETTVVLVTPGDAKDNKVTTEQVLEQLHKNLVEGRTHRNREVDE